MPKDFTIPKYFYAGCPNCPEPKTTLEHGDHVFINVTVTYYGVKCLVVANCTICGFVENLTDTVWIKQLSHNTMMKMLDSIEEPGD